MGETSYLLLQGRHGAALHLEEIKMSTVGKGTVLPISDNQPRIPGSVGHVVIGGVAHQGTNVGPGQVRTPDNKVHGTN